eukprot:CAMPEP_0174381620 /NCGR_PEP_ID=MMETSP0811_2-20130205/124134_1 /TAXON_ID=73025 ORGANISM="Eutreptiella gymnastica-like, Strain CCMP1594" /NCGR_SAMPLE_ID=MMETSP0811_2 /ASSEMBLY_ACC=CAM_ASM_000667 /LENGTH=90 /DNA_ID=CAMNT_0015534823 /DNA_START=58 /DNA_END=330 /DNA_ORIENTATION=+
MKQIGPTPSVAGRLMDSEPPMLSLLQQAPCPCAQEPLGVANLSLKAWAKPTTVYNIKCTAGRAQGDQNPRFTGKERKQGANVQYALRWHL